MIGGSLNIVSLSKTGVGTGGSVEGAVRLNITQNKQSIVIYNPHGIPAPSEKVFRINPSYVSGRRLQYGVPISWQNYIQGDQLLWANGIDPIQLYNNGSVYYDAGLVAPRDAPTAQDVTATGTLRPISVACGPSGGSCPYPDGPPTDLGHCVQRWVDATGVEHNSSTDPTGYVCNSYQAINEVNVDDASYIMIGEGGFAPIASPQYGRFRLQPPSQTPNVTTGHSFLFRIKLAPVGDPVGNGYTMNFMAHLYQGTTLIKSSANFVYADLTTSFVDHTVTLSSSEAANITDYTNLYLVLVLSPSETDSSNYHRVLVSYTAMTVPAGGAFLPTGAYSYVYTYVRSATGVESGPSPILDYTHSSVVCIELAGLLLSDDPTVDFINIYRTTKGGEVYFLVATIPNSNNAAWEAGGGTEITAVDPTIYADGIIDCVDDVTAGGHQRLNIPQKRTYGEGLPPRVRYLKAHLNRVFGAGAYIDANYVAGTALFTFGSTMVTGTGTHWVERMTGRSIRLDSAPASQTYTIAKVVSETEITLTTAFDQSTTSGFYTIRDNNRNPYTLYWSYPGFPEDWPSTNGLTIEGETGEGITGLAVMHETLIIFTKDAIYGLSGNDESSFRIDPIYKGIGCLSGHSIVETGDTIQFLDHDGLFLFDGSGPPLPISSPDAQNGQITGIDRDINDVNQARARMTCAYYNDQSRTYHTFASLNELENNHSLIYDSVVKSWMKDDEPGVFCCAPIFNEDDDKIYLVGTVDGCIFQKDVGLSDGAYAGTIVASVTSATEQIITCSGANFDTSGSGLIGVPINLVDQYGNYTRLRLINNSATQLNLLFPLKFIPDTTYKVVIGTIPMVVQSGHVNYGSSHKPNVLQYVELGYQPDTQGVVWMKAGSSFGPLEFLDSLDLTDTLGHGRINVRHKSRYIQTEILDIVPGHKCEINSIEHFVLGEPTNAQS